MKNRSTQVALLLMLAISVFASCDNTKNENKEQPQPATLTITNPDNEAEILDNEECDSTNINIATIDIPGDVKVNIHRGKSMLLEMDGVSLSAPDTAIIRKGTYTVTALTTEELPPLADEMVNVTFGSGNGYRFLPNGEHFSPYAELRMSYDESKLPHGYTPDDIYTSYYDEEKKTWVRLFRKEVDTVNKEIVSLTTHFTDFVNEILKAPEMPETQAFVPTMMTDLEAANPLEGITMIQPPTANNMGTANLSYPLQIPAGRQGMQPNLALTYNSSGGNGWLGVGWDISIPCISVETRWGVPRYESEKESESYLLNGEQLVMKGIDGSIYLPHRNSNFISRSDTNEQRFYPRIDETKDSIVRHGTSPQNYWWSVTDRTGITHYYGKKKGADTLDTESVLRGVDGNIAKWMLTESIDPNGNTVRYYYEITKPQNIFSLGKTIYPSSIEYTGHYDEESIYHSGKYEIRFNRQGIVRPDIITSCNYGFEEVIDAILCNVTVAYDDKPFRLYHFYMHNSENTLHKTVLNKVGMIDSIMCGIDVISTIANNYCNTDSLATIQNVMSTCGSESITSFVNTTNATSYIMGNYIENKYNYSVVEHTFEYNTAPEKVFSEQIVEINDLNNVGLTLPEKLLGATGYNVTELGLTKGRGWNVGGGANIGLGPIVAMTNSSAGLSYNYGNSTSKGKLTLIDIDGDGYQDKVFVYMGDIYYCKRINDDNGKFSYSEGKKIEGLSNVGTFMKEKSHSHTLSGQLNFHASVNLSETWTTSYTETYFSDVNADGLPDLVTEKGVYFNDTDTAGNVSFFMQPNEESGIDTIRTKLMNCGSMIYDGELNESIYCTTIDTASMIEKDLDELDSFIGYLIEVGWTIDSIVRINDTSDLYMTYYHKRITTCDSINSISEQMVSMGNTEAIKVWVAPYLGEIEIVSKINMYDTTGGLKLSRYADGVSYKVQHDRIKYSNVTDTFSLLNSAIIDDLSGTLTKDDTLEINKTKTLKVRQGDIIYFRLQSNNTNYYDHVEWKQSIRYTNLDYSEDTYGKPINQYNSYEDFIVTGNKYFQAIDTGSLDLTIDVNVGQLNSPARLRVYKNASVVFDTFLPSNLGYTTFYKSFYVNKNDSVKIKITDYLLSNETTFGNIVCKPHYNFTPTNDSVIKGSVEYDIPAYYYVNTNIKPIYTNIFGPLYRGWGQFTYNPEHHETPINIADLILMLPVDSSDVPYIDTNIVSPDNIDTMNMSFETFNNIVESNDLNLVSTKAKYYVMEGNSKHWLWYGPANATMITSTQMSNTIRTDIYSTYEEEVEIIRDCPAPAPTTEYPSVKTHSKTSKSSNFNRNYSADFKIYGNVGYSRNSGKSEITADFMDLNGDRYPDLIAKSIQYTKPSGGLESKGYPNLVSTSDATSSGGIEKGGSAIVAAYLHNRKNQTANCSETTGSALDNVSASATTGVGSSNEILIDINGDGLPDKISENGIIFLNWGYHFLPTAVNWLNGFQRKSVFITGGINYSENDLFNICQFSIGGGFGINYSHNETEKMLIDINGDGLPDKIGRTNDTTFWVMYNVGNGRWEKINVDIPDIIRSYSLSGSTNISGTIGFTVFGAKATGTLSGSVFNPSCSVDKVQLADFNNDGLPDFVTSDSIGTINVRYNQLGGVNLLTKVTYPMEGTIEIDYSLTESSIRNPHRQWVMDKVTIDAQNSPIGGSVMKNAFEYSNPYYDRYERTSYGFEKVRTSNLDSNNNVYRYTEENYVNTNYALKNKLKKVALFDGSGNKYTETLYDMEIIDPEYNEPADDNCLYWIAPIIKTEINNFYEGAPTAQLTTMISYEYDKYQNIDSYHDWGDTTFTDDDLIVDIVYYAGMSHNMVGLKKNFTIKSVKDSVVMREYDFDYNEQGKLTIEKIYNNDGTEAIYDMSYDSYGNVLNFIKPADENGGRQNYYYTYDNVTYTYPTSITDAFNLTATTTYDYRFGVPLEKTDPAGNRMVYTYDYRGRTKTITGPKELAANKPYTIFMEYYPTEGTGQGVNMGVNRQFPYSITYHYDQQHPNDNIETIVICDKIGRILQTKKDAVVNGVPKNMVSGKIQLDEFGRTIKQYLPFSESTGNDTIYSGTATGTPTMMEYDIMDRQTNITYPGNAVFTSGYSVANDYSGKRRFLTKTTDPLNRITYTYTDYTGKNIEIIDALNGSTRMEYDCMHQLLKTIDPEGYVTMYEYDNMGRMTQRIHPDAGSTKYEYNPAGQPTRKIVESGDYITYKYDLNRLIEVHYSKYPQNNVSYTYNNSGQIREIYSAGIIKRINYGNMGEVIEEINVIPIPNSNNIYVFKTGFEYDSWNRIQRMTYSDGEEVYYEYDCGGNLAAMHGVKNGTTTPYIKEILYNEQGKRSRILYGNGVETTYKYDTRMRLHNLLCTDNSGNQLQNIEYTYDDVDNILVVKNISNSVGSLGGSYVYEHEYDGINRLLSSMGTYNNTSIGTIGYNYNMQYTAAGKLKNKFSSNNVYRNLYYAYCNEYKPHAPRRVLNSHSGNIVDLRWDENGNLGQMNFYDNDGMGIQSRYIGWTEDNRITNILDKSYHSYYTYDDAGERVLKLTGQNNIIDINADNISYYNILNNITMYTSPYLVAHNKGYTKHYYAGSERVCAAIGEGGLSNLVPCIYQYKNIQEASDDLFYHTLKNISDRNLLDNNNCLNYDKDMSDILFRHLELMPEHVFVDSKVDPSSFHTTIEIYCSQDNPNSAVYFYHSDHLGSASWITNGNGTPIQHLQYMPYGEPFVNERISSYNERFTFTGKERDSETGYSYFGARYYDSDILTGWLSVDPMADKFPNISPYNYCNWNPVKLKDPDGEFPFVTNIVGGVVSVVVEYGSQVIENCIENNGLSIGAFTDVDVFDLGVAAMEGFVTSGTNIVKKAVVKTATEVGASIVTNAVDISTDGDVKINAVTEIGVGVITDRVGEIKVLNKKLHSPIPKSANKAVKEARAEKGSLPTKQAKQIAEKQRKKNEDQKAVYKMLEDQIQKHPSKVFEAMINNLTQE